MSNIHEFSLGLNLFLFVPLHDSQSHMKLSHWLVFMVPLTKSIQIESN